MEIENKFPRRNFLNFFSYSSTTTFIAFVGDAL